MLPNFLVVGAQKSGTTSLHEYLRMHPDIYLPEQKESKHFVMDERYNKGLSAYEREFYSSWSGEKSVGEVDPDYMFFECALDRIAKHFDMSGLKFIFILRNPVDRAFSHYLMTYRRGLDNLPFEEAIKRERERVDEGYEGKMHYSYLARGFYRHQIERFLKLVDRSQVLFLLSDDLAVDGEACLKGVFRFLGVVEDFVPSNLEQRFHGARLPRSMSLLRRVMANDTLEKKLLRCLLPSKKLRIRLRSGLLRWNQSSKESMEMSLKTRVYLEELYSAENQKLAQLIGRDLSIWRQSIKRSGHEHSGSLPSQ